MAERTYKHAKALLAQLRAPRSDKSPRSSFRPIRDHPNSGTLRGTPHIEGMKPWLQRLGYTDSIINNLNVIHVAGTKGKGSTCAFIDSFLRSHQSRTGFPRKIGLYTSPHLVEYTERIRINFVPLSEETFAKNFFEIWDRLGLHPEGKGPRSLQLLALLSFHTFVKEGVDVAIYETHHGGEYDVTNIVEKPAVTAITSIGLDHVEELGPRIENIAWHKAGIFKEGVIAFSAPQKPEVELVLRKRAKQKHAILEFVDISGSVDIPKDLSIPTQRINAYLAQGITAAWLSSRTPARSLSPQDIRTGIENFVWPGRFQTIQWKNVLWCLDGAHNPMSAAEAARWFDSIPDARLSTPNERLLVFALDSDRHDAFGTLKSLRDSLRGSLPCVIFTSDTNNMDTPRLRNFELLWKERYPDTKVIIAHPKDVITRVREIGKDGAAVHVLVTGSLYLVGYVLEVLS